MALSCDSCDMLCPISRQSSRRFEQVLHDNGLFLDWDHDLPDVRSNLRHSKVDREGGIGEGLYLRGSIQQ